MSAGTFKMWGFGSDERGLYILGTSGEPPSITTVKVYIGKGDAKILSMALDTAFKAEGK